MTTLIKLFKNEFERGDWKSAIFLIHVPKKFTKILDLDDLKTCNKIGSNEDMKTRSKKERDKRLKKGAKICKVYLYGLSFQSFKVITCAQKIISHNSK